MNSTRRFEAKIRMLPPYASQKFEDHGSEDTIREECGVFGIYGHPEAAKLTYLGLYALQHRGQEGAGIVCADNGVLTAHRGVGLVNDVFRPHKLARVNGTHGIGHVRYSTFGSSNLKNVQPLVVDYARGCMALCHNGNLVNAAVLRDQLEAEGAIFQATTDTAVLVHLVARSRETTFTDTIIEACKQVIGAYTILAMNEQEIVAVRDAYGFRPLWLGKLEQAYVLASETCALDIIDADWVREIEPGEVVTINKEGITSQKPFEKVTPQQCIFEFIYVSRPDSDIFGKSVNAIRQEMGCALARVSPVEADLVMAVPDSSNPAALGYAHESGIPFEMGFIRNHYVGRTFIEPDQKIRDFGVKIKLNPSRSTVAGKRVVLVDDSIVRGTTAKKIIKLLRVRGAKEVHFRVASPPIIGSCYYGIDTPNRSKLIAHNLSVEEIRDFLEVDSLAYLPIPDMLKATGLNPAHFCTACFNNIYPTPTPDQFQPSKEAVRHIDHSIDPYGV
ncbi:MAG TPA: amidophosphoribosyltransferase [Candidatus Hydrogenedentes bacterium]|nr:amidophosphoribosyltransferase [Candidatus Hydrogenedentota bacterium]